MITYSSYEFDNRVRRYAESLAARGDEVDVLAVAWENKGARTTFLDGVKVTRLSRKMTFGKGLFTYFAHVCRFPLAAFGVVSARVLAKPYDFVHVHNMPDFLVFCALFARLRGAKVILDLHDLVPELYADKKPGWRQSFAGHLLRWEERISARFVQHLIISNHLWLKTVTGRSAAAEKCSVFVNNVDTRIFYPRKRTRSDDRRIILFHGSLSYHQGVDLVIQAMPTVLARVPKAEFHVYGGPSERCEELGRLAREVGAEQAVRFSPSVLLHEIPQIIADADVGVVAKRADSFGNLAYSTKILEFMSQGIPVVLARTEIDQYYFDDTVARFFPSGDVPALADALVEVLLDSELKNRLTRNATDYVRRNSWETRKQAYFAIVDALCDKKTVVPSV
jgi:glycosyltransferase involved in cell wall biosynthesis